jgi:DNA-binding response OmpR family regulator
MQLKQPARPVCAPLRVLLVEDHPDGRESLRQLLTLLGYEVTTAADGEEGVTMGLETRPDVAIIDINLPKMGGRQVAERLRRTLGEAVALIAYTACDEGKVDRRGIGTAFNDWVIKPGELPELLSRLDCRRTRRS